MTKLNLLGPVSVLLVIGVAASGCGSGEEQAPAPAPTVAATSSSEQPETHDHSHGTDAGEPIPVPEVVEGADEEAVSATAENFIAEWATYRSAAQQPRSDWFDSWKDMATDQFIQQQRRSFNTLWSWTWNEEKQVLGAQRDGDIEVHLEDNVAIARVPVKRFIFGIDSRIDEGKEQKLTFDVFLNIADGTKPLVTNVREVTEDEPFPPRNRS